MQGILLITMAMCLAPSLSWAQQPVRCKTPDLFTGRLKVATQDEDVYAFGKFAYDAINERIHLGEIVIYEQWNYTYEVLMLYQQSIMYEIHRHKQTCVKNVLQGDFHPFEIPKDATFTGQAALGTLAYPGEGLVVNTWMGQTPKSEAYMVSFTESGCLPVSGFLKTQDMGWMSLSYFDNMLGVPDPDAFIPPPFCQHTKLEDGKKVDFFHSIFY